MGGNSNLKTHNSKLRSIGLRLFDVLTAAGASTREHYLLLIDFAADQVLHRAPIDFPDTADVGDLIASRADEVSVFGGVCVEVGTAVVTVDLSYQPFTLEDAEVAIDRAERHLGQAAAYFFACRNLRAERRRLCRGMS